LSLSRPNHFKQVDCRVLNVSVAILASSRFRSKNAAAMNIFKVTVGKFVSPLGVLGVAIVNSQMPFCVLIEAMLPNELILELARRPVFGPRAFSVKHDSSTVDELRGVLQSGRV
jgi:hypothetical protein